MKSDSAKTKNELIEELNYLRRRSAEADELRRRLAEVQKHALRLQNRCQARTEELTKECTQRDQTEEALRMAEVIVDRSPVILFRRTGR